MRVLFIAVLCLLAGSAFASDTLRVGSQLLVSGDSAAHVRELLGRPSHVTHHRGSHRRRGVASPASERWVYHRDGSEITVTLVDGAVAQIMQRP